MANHKHSANSNVNSDNDYSETYQHVRKEIQMTNGEDKGRFSFSYNEIRDWLGLFWKIGGLIVICLVAYFGLDSRISVNDQKITLILKNQERVQASLDSISCNTRQLNNFMNYGIRPKPEDRC